MDKVKDIKELRTLLKMSQSEFAAYFNVSVRTLQGWEQGKKPPEGMFSMMLRIAELEGKINS